MASTKAERAVKRAMANITKGDLLRYAALAARNADQASFRKALFPDNWDYAARMFNLMKTDLVTFLLKLDIACSEAFAKWVIQRQGL